MWMSCKYSNCAVYLRQLTALPSVTDNWFTKLIPIFIKLRDKVHVSLTEYITETMSCHEVHTVNTIGLFCAEILTWLTLLCKSHFFPRSQTFLKFFNCSWASTQGCYLRNRFCSNTVYLIQVFFKLSYKLTPLCHFSLLYCSTKTQFFHEYKIQYKILPTF